MGRDTLIAHTGVSRPYAIRTAGRKQLVLRFAACRATAARHPTVDGDAGVLTACTAQREPPTQHDGGNTLPTRRQCEPGATPMFGATPGRRCRSLHGQGGIRTHGTVSGTPVFETGSFNLSDTRPDAKALAQS